MDIQSLVRELREKIKKQPYEYMGYEGLFNACRLMLRDDFGAGLGCLRWLSEQIMENMPVIVTANRGDAGKLYALHKSVLLAAAPYDFDSFLLYVEWNREPSKKFYAPRRKQLKVVVDALQDLSDDKLDLLAISMPPGVGKALANDTPVLTRQGWKFHGDLQVGDEVIGMDGKFKKVLAVHPKCMLDCLVEFTNGEMIQCHENHEWLIHDRARRIESERDYVAETKRIEKRALNSGGEVGHRGHRYTVQLPRKEYIVGEEKELTVDPYTLGVWLGDGTNKNPTICCAENDKAVINRVVANGNPIRWNTVHKTTGVLYFGFGFRNGLQTYGMCHSRKTKPKRIPDDYLTASVGQRLNLLAGLLDTDGTLIGSKYQFTTAEPSLRDSFIALISTFGWRASITYHRPIASSSGIKAKKWHYVIGFTPDTEIPCELERKRNKEPHKQRAIGFKSVSRVAPKEGNCITVEDGMYLVGRTMLPTHNSTLAIFYMTWLAGKYPDSPILTGSHSNSWVRGAYDECLRIMEPNGEYLWHDVFPGVNVTSTNAKDCRIDLGTRKRFESLQFTSIGTGNAGLYRAMQLLYCDDLVSGSEVALSKERLDKLWGIYTTDLRQRKLGDRCKELHISTRWSVYDVVGRLEMEYMDNDRARFITMPAMDEKDESLWDYPYNLGYSTKTLREQREVMDDVDWRALFMNQPIEREGLLYSADELRRYFELPDGEPDAIIAACDTKDRGIDYFVMPVAYQYGPDFYIDGVVCDNGNPDVVEPRLVNILVDRGVQLARFESNQAGGRIASSVQEKVKDAGGRCKITTKYTTAQKETKIIVNSPWVKEHCLFKDDSVIKNDKEYRRFMQFLCGWTMAGKNKHDDVPDGMAQLAEFVQSFAMNRVEIVKRPF